MPISSIPLPSSFGDSLLEGLKTGQGLFDSMASNKRGNAQLDLQAQQQARAQTLLPYLIQKYMDEHQQQISAQDIQKMVLGMSAGSDDRPPPAIAANMNNASPSNMGAPSASMAAPSASMGPPSAPMPGQKLTPEQRQKLTDYAMNNDLPADQLEQIQGFLDKDAQADVPQRTSAPPVQSSGAQETVLHPGDAKLAWKDKLAGVDLPKLGLRIPSPKTSTDANGNITTVYPSGKITSMQNPGTAQSKFKEKVAENDATILKGLQDSVIASYPLNDKIQRLQSLVNSPTWKEIRKTPLFAKQELDYIGKKGTPEQRNMVGQFRNMTNEVVADIARNFAGSGSRFYAGELPIATASKVNDSDSVEEAQGKLESALALRNLQMKRTMRAIELARNGTPPEIALQQADKDVNGALYRKMAQKQLGLSDDQLAKLREQGTQGTSGAPGKVTIIDSNGKEWSIDDDEKTLSIARQRDPGLKVKGK